MSLVFKFHSPAQESLTRLNPGTKIMVANCGRSVGKTTSAGVVSCIYTWNSPGSGIFYIAPTYDQCKSACKLFVDVIVPNTSGLDKYIERTYITTQRVEIVLKNKKSIIYRSGDNPGSLRSNNMISSIILDECGEMDDDVDATTKTNTLRWSSHPWGGFRFYYGTPRGFNFFYDKYLSAIKCPKEYTHRHFTTYDNPMFAKEYVDKLYKQYCDEKGLEWARQEIYAEFTTLNNTVFRGLEKCIVDQAQIDTERKDRRTALGVDVALKRDETAFLAIDIDTFEILHSSVLYQADQITQYNRVIDLWHEYNKPQVFVDATRELFFSADMQNYIDNRGCRELFIEPIVIGRKNKPEMISKVASLVARAMLKIPRTEECMKLVSQMNTYEQKISDAGNIKTAASGRNKDDRVSALMLACIPIELDYGDTETKVELDAQGIMTLKQRQYYRQGGY